MKSLIIIGLILSLTPTEAKSPEPPKVQEETYVEVGGHFYTLGQITWAVAIREGGWNFFHSGKTAVCGIKRDGEYQFTNGEDGIRRCLELLSRRLRADGYTRGLARWKTGNPSDTTEATQKYIKDIQTILEKNAYSYSL